MDAEATRQRIIDATIDVLRRRGPAYVSLRSVAKCAGVSVSLISHHFISKDELILACLQTMCDELCKWETHFRRLHDEAQTPIADLLAEMVHIGFHFSRQHRAMIRAGLRIVADQGAMPERWRENVLEPFLDRWSQNLSRRTGIDKGVLRLRLVTLVITCARFALSSEAELLSIVGNKQMSMEAATENIERHLTDIASTMILGA